MGNRLPSSLTNAAQNALPASNAETQVLLTPPLDGGLDSATMLVLFSVPITAGTGTTAIVVKIRRGNGLTGVDITGGGWTTTLAAGSSAVLSGIVYDQPGAVADSSYSLTVSQTGATVAGTIGTNPTMEVIVI